MYGDMSSEVVHCPNCAEDVPKTLYCLNCGYPLYKIEPQRKEDLVEVPEVAEVATPDETTVDMSVEIEQSEKVFSLDKSDPEQEIEEATIEVEEPGVEFIVEPEIIDEEIAIEELSEEEELLDTDEPLLEETEAFETEEPEVEFIREEPEAELEEPIEEIKVEEEVIELEEPEEYMEPEEEQEYKEPKPEPEEAEEPEIKTVTEPIEHTYSLEMRPDLMEEIKIEFAPDPLTKEVMENLAKNITLKIRLVRLLRDGQVKEETFKKLFDSYVEQGRLWVSRREEIIRRFNADIERMEHQLITARKDYELLEIRKSIGDADDEEYDVKAPAYRWDIEHLEKEITNRKGGMLYVADLQKLCPKNEVIELQRMADSEYNELESVEGVSTETITKMKETLAEALNSLQS